MCVSASTCLFVCTGQCTNLGVVPPAATHTSETLWSWSYRCGSGLPRCVLESNLRPSVGTVHPLKHHTALFILLVLFFVVAVLFLIEGLSTVLEPVKQARLTSQWFPRFFCIHLPNPGIASIVFHALPFSVPSGYQTQVLKLAGQILTDQACFPPAPSKRILISHSPSECVPWIACVFTLTLQGFLCGYLLKTCSFPKNLS